MTVDLNEKLLYFAVNDGLDRCAFKIKSTISSEPYRLAACPGYGQVKIISFRHIDTRSVKNSVFFVIAMYRNACIHRH